MTNLLAYIGCCLIWSTTWLFIKTGLECFSPLTFLAVRFLIAGPVLLVAARFTGEPLTPPDRKEWCLAGILGFGTLALPYACIYLGESRLPSGLTAVLFSLQPLFAVGFAHFLLARERFRPAQLVGMLLGVGGVVLVCRSQLHGHAALSGALAIVGAAFVQGYMAVFIKKLGRHGPQFTGLGWAHLFAGAMMMLPALLLERHPVRAITPGGIFSLLYLAVFGSAVAFVLVFRLFRHWEATKASTISLVTPPLALFWGWLYLHEPLGADYLLGALLVVLGVWQANRVKASSSSP